MKKLDQVKICRYKQLSVILLVLLISAPVFMQTSKAQADGPSLQDKALAFLTDVVQLDLTNYAVSTNQQYTSKDHISLNLDARNADPLYHIIAGFNFYNNSVRYCSLSPGSAGLPHSHPTADRFNATLGFMERYQKWTNDPQVQEMMMLLDKVGSEKNATEASGNLTLRILCSNFVTTYSFRNTFSGAEYTGISIYYGNKIEDFTFDDNRQFQKIGDVTINISKERAISIAKEYLKTYTVKSTLANGTTVKVSNLNVTGVYSAVLQTSVRVNNTLYPLWNIQLNVSNMPARGLQGVGVWVWSNDGVVLSAYNYAYPMDFDPFLDALFFPLLMDALTPLIILICVAIVVIVVLVSFLRRNKEANNVARRTPHSEKYSSTIVRCLSMSCFS